MSISWETAQISLAHSRRYIDSTKYVTSHIEGIKDDPDDSKKTQAVIDYARRYCIAVGARIAEKYREGIFSVHPLSGMSSLSCYEFNYYGELEPGFSDVEDELKDPAKNADRYTWLENYGNLLDRLKKEAPDLFEDWHSKTKERVEAVLSTRRIVYIV